MAIFLFYAYLLPLLAHILPIDLLLTSSSSLHFDQLIFNMSFPLSKRYSLESLINFIPFFFIIIVIIICFSLLSSFLQLLQILFR